MKDPLPLLRTLGAPSTAEALGPHTGPPCWRGCFPFSSSSVNPSHAGAHTGVPGPAWASPSTPYPPLHYHGKFSEDSLGAQMVKSLPAVQETQVQSLGQEDPREKEMATHSSIPAWKIP